MDEVDNKDAKILEEEITTTTEITDKETTEWVADKETTEWVADKETIVLVEEEVQETIEAIMVEMETIETLKNDFNN